MKKRIFSLVLVSLLLVALLAACAESEDKTPSEGITQQKACQIAVEAAGHELTEVTGLHAHEGDQNGATIYEIHFSCGEESYTYVIHGETGEILSKKP